MRTAPPRPVPDGSRPASAKIRAYGLPPPRVIGGFTAKPRHVFPSRQPHRRPDADTLLFPLAISIFTMTGHRRAHTGRRRHEMTHFALSRR